MTSYYKYLPNKSTRRSKLGKRQIRQYFFACTLLLTIVFLTLYEFYFTIVERSKNGETEAGILEAMICQVFSLAVCSKRDNSALLQLRETVQQINKAQVIRNFEGHDLTDDTVIIVIQVHTRTAYLKEVIDSLRCVRDIDSTILVFSHDYFCDEINALILAIDFAPFMQIFFPFSIQLYPNEFPGTDPRDCPWNIDVEKARAVECLGAKTPDAYNHYRQGSVTQIKHHWWWKINTVFDNLSITNNFEGFLLFLEEDHYVSPDILHTLRLMVNLASQQCPQCNSFHLGNFKEYDVFDQNADKVDMAPWNNLGFAFNRSMWDSVSACASVFCTFDDYNWDWSLQYTLQECFFQELAPLVVRYSRVFHIGDCGVHHIEEGCDLKDSLQKAKDLLEIAEPFLYPKSLILEKTSFNNKKISKGWGGWADPRDIEMCVNMSSQRKTMSDS